MNGKEIGRIMEETTLETLAEDIKKTRAYKIYELAVKDGKEYTNDVLALLVSMHSLKDVEIGAKVDKVAWEILYAMLDQRYRAEIKKTTAEGGNP